MILEKNITLNNSILYMSESINNHLHEQWRVTWYVNWEIVEEIIEPQESTYIYPSSTI